MDSVTEEIEHQHHEVLIVANLLIQYARTGDINNLGGYQGACFADKSSGSCG